MEITRLLNWRGLKEPRTAGEWHELVAGFIRRIDMLNPVEREMLARLVEQGPPAKRGAPGRSFTEKAILRGMTAGTANPVARLSAMLRIERDAAKSLHRQLRKLPNFSANMELYDRLYAQAEAALKKRERGE